MSSFLSVAAEVDFTVRAAPTVDGIVVGFNPAGSLSKLASVHLTAEDAYSLVDAIQGALRQVATANAGEDS